MSDKRIITTESEYPAVKEFVNKCRRIAVPGSNHEVVYSDNWIWTGDKNKQEDARTFAIDRYGFDPFIQPVVYKEYISE